MKGLDATIVKLSALKVDNDKLRIDSGFFAKTALQSARVISTKKTERFGTIASTLRKGIFDIKSDTYVEVGEGVPFVRIGYMQNGLINSDTTEWISFDAHAREVKTQLHYGDIVLSKTAYAAASFVNIADCNVSQDVIAVRLGSTFKKRFKEGYVVSYLNSKYGMALMSRYFQGNVQQHLSLDDAKKIPIPEFSVKFQTLIDGRFRRADKLRLDAIRNMGKAEAALLANLGLDSWTPSEPLSYVSAFADVIKLGRLDAQFYAPRIRGLIKRLSKTGSTLSAVASPRREKFDRLSCGTFNYIEIGDVDRSGTARSTELACIDAPSRATWLVHPGDIITSTVRPIRRLSAQVLPEQKRFVASSGFVVLKPTNVPPEVLLTFLRLPVVCELMDLFASASMYPAISEADILKLPFPIVDGKAAKAICKAVQQSRVALADAASLLDESKHAVEVAIKGNEAAALLILKQTGG